MQPVQEKLEFAVRLAQIDLVNIRPGDLLNLRDDLETFFMKKGEDMRGPIGEIVIPFGHPLPHEYSIDDFQKLQKDLYSILDEIVAGRDTGHFAAPTREIKAKLTALSVHIKNRSILQATGSTRDMFLLRLFLLLSQEPFDRILRCKASDCDQLFYRRRKQAFCSTRCTNRAYMKTYPRKETGSKPAPRSQSKKAASKGKKIAQRSRKRSRTIVL